jgi:hypothetical protein
MHSMDGDGDGPVEIRKPVRQKAVGQAMTSHKIRCCRKLPAAKLFQLHDTGLSALYTAVKVKVTVEEKLASVKASHKKLPINAFHLLQVCNQGR